MPTTTLKSASQRVCDELGITGRLQQIEAEEARVATDAEREKQRLKDERNELHAKLQPLREMEATRRDLQLRVSNLTATRAELKRLEAEIDARCQLHFSSGRCDAQFAGSVREWFGSPTFDSVVFGLPRLEKALKDYERQLAEIDEAVVSFKREHGVE